MQTMARPTIRPALPSDVDRLRSVILRANEPFQGQPGVPDSFFASYLANATDVERRMREGEVLAAELDERVVGTITFYRDANDEGAPARFPPCTAGIRATAVDPAAQGLGIGRALVDACIERAAAVDARGIALHTAEFMRVAIAVYERAGFRRTPELDFATSLFFPSEPGDDVVAIAYVRSIP